MFPCNGKLTPAQLQKWIDERVRAILDARRASLTEAVGMLRCENFGLSELLTAMVCAQLDGGQVADLAVAMADSVRRDHKLQRDWDRSRPGKDGGA